MYKCIIDNSEVRFNTKQEFIMFSVDNLNEISAVEYIGETSLRLNIDNNKPLALEWFCDTLNGGDKMYQKQKSKH